MSAKIELLPLDGPFGLEVRGIDMSCLPDLETLEAVKFAFHQHGLLLIRGQEITPAQQVAFSRLFGELEEHVNVQFLLPGFPEIFVVGNKVEDGRRVAALNCALSWHSDHSYHAEPSLGSLFYGVQVPPEGGDTLFAEMYRPYEDLPTATKAALEGMQAIHDYRRLVEVQFPQNAPPEEAMARVPPVAHPIVRTHPVTRRRSLFLGGEVISGTIRDGVAGTRDVVVELLEYATQDKYVYRHKWRKGDMVLWDNRCTMHRAGAPDPGKHLRVMHRTTLRGGRPF
ncbi:TauD/TfdA dioxygenase family protein [Roseomonas chloroacetimidivorans]|uniref:TauD/TfdA dioxygenase family protein n=1 Tax=Roseomonas chloroacetimidivorans TaxID=1766656 RepID=UPI003C78B6E3